MVHSPPLICSFCGKTETPENQVIAGPAVYICFECVEVCAGVMRLMTMPPVTVTRVVRNKSGSHPFIHWLARWLPIDPYVEWDWPEQVPDDHVYFAKGVMFAPPHIRRALIEQAGRKRDTNHPAENAGETVVATEPSTYPTDRQGKEGQT